MLSVAYCTVKDTNTELVVKGADDDKPFVPELTQGLAAECVSEIGKEHCSAIGGECITERDGYYYVSAICIAFGVLFLVGYIMPTARRLECESIECFLTQLVTVRVAIPIQRWRVSSE